MDPSALPRLREWLERPEIASLDPRRIEALAAALAEPDPPVRVERWGTVVGYEAGPPRRRLVQFDRHGHLIAACRWSAEGALDWARCRAADGRWIGVEPGAIEHPAWGRSDRVWLLDGEDPWHPVEPLTVFRSLDWARLDHIPPLAEPRRLPPGAGSAVLNLVASLMKDQGVARVRYRGPFASEQLFTTLLECFRYDPGQALPLERFLADGGLDWLPAPYESHRVTAWATVQLRQDIDAALLYARTQPRFDGQRVALAGHSMGAFAVVSHAQQDPGVAAVVAISGGGALRGPFAPPNTLFIWAANDPAGLRKNARELAAKLAGLEQLVGDKTYGEVDHGTGVRMSEIPAVDHITILYSAEAARRIVEWLGETLGPGSGSPETPGPDPRFPFMGLGLAAALVLAFGLPQLLAPLAPRMGLAPVAHPFAPGGGRGR